MSNNFVNVKDLEEKTFGAVYDDREIIQGTRDEFKELLTPLLTAALMPLYLEIARLKALCIEGYENLLIERSEDVINSSGYKQAVRDFIDKNKLGPIEGSETKNQTGSTPQG